MNALVSGTGAGRNTGNLQARTKTGRFAAHLAGLTEKQAKFVENVVLLGMKQTPAAAAAGYANSKDAGHTLVRTPHVAKAIRDLQRKELDVNLASMAINGLRSILSMKDQLLQTAAGTKIYLDACIRVLDRSICSTERLDDEASINQVDRMSRDEMRDKLEMLLVSLKAEDGKELFEGDETPAVGEDREYGVSRLPALRDHEKLSALDGSDAAPFEHVRGS
jgi:hypothetical protein